VAPAPRPIVTVLCLVALGVALVGATFVDEEQERSGRSGLAREAQGFAVALAGRSNDVLRYLTPNDRRDPRAIEELRDIMSQLGPGADLLVSRVTLPEGRQSAATEIQFTRPSRRGSVLGGAIRVDWERAADGSWKARILDR
jgi:hypothetical protein